MPRRFKRRAILSRPCGTGNRRDSEDDNRVSWLHKWQSDCEIVSQGLGPQVLCGSDGTAEADAMP